MRVLIQRENGTRSDALILAVSKHRLRISAAGTSETEELIYGNGEWYDERGQITRIEALMAVDGVDYAAIFAEIWPLTATASGRLT